MTGTTKRRPSFMAIWGLLVLGASLNLVAMTGCADADHDDDEMNDSTEAVMTGAENTDETADATTPAAQPELVDGVQVITVKVEDMGYTPERIAFKEGVPAKIIFDQHGTTECAWSVMSGDLNISKTELPKDQKTEVTFTPEKAGTYSFTCGMNMLKGTVVVES